MQSMTFDPSAADIGPQVVDNAAQGLQAGATAATSFTELVPAGADDVSVQATMAFAEEAGQMLAVNQAAQRRTHAHGRGLHTDRADVCKSRRLGCQASRCHTIRRLRAGQGVWAIGRLHRACAILDRCLIATCWAVRWNRAAINH